MTERPMHETASTERVERREETVSRVAREAPAVDPTTRRRIPERLLQRGAITAVIGAVIAVAAALIAGRFSSTLAVDGALATAIVIIVFAAVGALIGFVISSLLVLEREDGRVERAVERKVNRAP